MRGILKEMKKTRDGRREKETFGGMWLIGVRGLIVKARGRNSCDRLDYAQKNENWAGGLISF